MKDDISKVEVPRDLPHDLVVDHVLTRLPIKPLVKFKSVSKQWYSTISSSQSAHMYSKLSLSANPSSPIQYLFIQNGNNYYLLSHDGDHGDDIGNSSSEVNKNLFELRIDFHAVFDGNLDLIGSCNGLVCLASSSGYFFILWNPVTREYWKYSDLEVSIDPPRPQRVSWGFGYVSNVDDYKVIRVLEMPAKGDIRVHVFSLKFNKWTRVSDELYRHIVSRSITSGSYSCHCGDRHLNLEFNFTSSSSRGLLVNETLYWIEAKRGVGKGNRIVAYDLVSEVFYGDVGLDLISSEVYGDDFICNMGGCLSKCGQNIVHDMVDGICIHMLKCPGKVESICPSRDFPVICCNDLVGFTRTGKFFIQWGYLGYSVVGIVDPSSEPVKYKRLVTFERSDSKFSRTSKIVGFVPSLTAPYAVEELSGNDNTC